MREIGGRAASCAWAALALLVGCGGGTGDATHDASTDAPTVEAGLDAGGADAGCGDEDSDGHRAASCGGDDCDDADPNRYPGATEVCDPADHDEDCDSATFGFRDSDSDGYGDIACCNAGGSGPICGDDCADANTNVHPSQTETCNGLDDNCDGRVDEGVTVAYVADCDGDHVGAGTPTTACAPPSTLPACASGVWVTVDGDCDDDDPLAAPGLSEVCDALGRDEDCDAATDGGVDADGDGASSSACCTRTSSGLSCGPDCDDDRASIGPSITEICNSADDDCDGSFDEGVVACTPPLARSGPCGATTCDFTTSFCCIEFGSGLPRCAATCLGTEIAYSCDGPEDCAPGELCLQRRLSVGQCGRDETDRERICHGDATCRPGLTCSTPFPGDPYPTCR